MKRHRTPDVDDKVPIIVFVIVGLVLGLLGWSVGWMVIR